MNQPSPARAALAPLRPRNRIDVVDVLRGFAIFGILLVNMASFSNPPSRWLAGVAGWEEPLERAIVLAIQFLAEAKFYTLFSFLFGWGMAIQMERAAARGGRFLPIYLRRLFVLLLIGITHALFIWSGDILVTYALIGFILLFLRNRSGRTLSAFILLLFAFILLFSGPGPGAALRQAYEGVVSPLRQAAEIAGGDPARVLKSGSYADVTVLRWYALKVSWTGAPYWGPHILGMFILGLLVGRKRIFQDLVDHLQGFRRLLIPALAAGLLCNLLWILASARPELLPESWFQVARRGGRALAGVSMAAFYVSAIVLLFQRPVWRARLLPLAAVGRLALSNYLLQSLVATLIFYGYGLGLFGEFGPLGGLVFSLLLFAAQVRLSQWWLERYDYGPAEALWRWLTYKRLPAVDPHPSALRRSLRALPVGLVLLLWVAGLAGLGLYLTDTPLTEVVVVDRLVATPTPRPRATTTPAPSPTPIATPAVAPVQRSPLAAAARGDLRSLAFAFDAERAFEDITKLAGPEYGGRLAGSPGGQAAAAYIADRFASYGLRPAGDDGSYFQPFTVAVATLQQPPHLTVTRPDGSRRSYTPRQDFSPSARLYTGEGTAAGPVVWAQNCWHDDFDLIDVTGAIVLCRFNRNQELGRNAVEHGAAGLLLMVDPETQPIDRIGPLRDAWIPQPIPALTITPAVAADLLAGSGLTLDDLSYRFTSFALATEARIEIDLAVDEQALARNVLGVLPGRDPAYAGEIVILGGHFDHMGQDPGGPMWAGANDNASGIAMLLEIARVWQEQGFVPRRTVLFAAWDAEELGLLGSIHYVDHPIYPLADTVAMLQLDMVGAGDDTLFIDGRGELAGQLAGIADAVGVTHDSLNRGRSDHAVFQEVGVDAALIIWFGEDDSAVPHYHRPLDTPAVIEPDKLAAAGRIAGLAVLGPAEGEPAVLDLLQTRAAAVQAGDLEVFRRTTAPAGWTGQAHWFEQAAALAPTSVEMVPVDLLVAGEVATATVRTAITYLDGEISRTISGEHRVQLRHGDEGWHWQGPALVQAEREPAAFTVAYAPGREGMAEGVGAFAANTYARIAGQLGLPPANTARLELFADAASLRAATDPEPEGQLLSWVGPGLARMVASSHITATARFTDTITRLVLANQGMEQADAPWLWRGLPLVLATAADPSAQAAYVPILATIFAAENVQPPQQAGDWAAVETLQQRLGWAGIGDLVEALGRGQTLDAALGEALGLDAVAFQESWQAEWRQRLGETQAAITALLAARTGAVRSGDTVAFARSASPGLRPQEQAWFAALTAQGVADFDLSGRPLAYLEGDRVLAEIKYRFRPQRQAQPARTSEATVTVLLEEMGGNLRWAGMPAQRQAGERVTLAYPPELAILAPQVLTLAEEGLGALLPDVGALPGQPYIVRMVADPAEYRVASAFAAPAAATAWTAPGAAVVWRVAGGEVAAEEEDALLRALYKQVLWRLGGCETPGSDACPHWFYDGLAAYAVAQRRGLEGVTEIALHLDGLLRDAQRDRLPGLETLPDPASLPADEAGPVLAYAREVARFFVQRNGWSGVQEVLAALARGVPFEIALEAADGKDMAELEAAWRATFARGYATPGQVQTAARFDVGAALAHIDTLAGWEYEGRKAGSAAAELAARYIADAFARAGVQPALGDSYRQRFPISYTVFSALPALAVVDAQGRTLESLTYRQDFTAARQVLPAGGVEAGVVWVREDYGDMQFNGRIVLRRPKHGANAEMEQAAAHGAGGLILVGDRRGDDLLAKTPLPPIAPSPAAIPVVELNADGFERLLAASGYGQGELMSSPPALLLPLRLRLSTPLAPPQTVEIANVLGLLPGADPALRDEVVILGAHYDHVGDDPDGLRYPGGNDNASGVAVLLEIARLWQAQGYRPARTVLFAAWTGQELGNLGSRYYQRHPVWPAEQVLAMLELDAIAGGRGYYLQALGDRRRDALPLFAMQVAAELAESRLTVERPDEGGPSLPLQEWPVALLVWTGANEQNLPLGLEDEIDPLRLGMSGRATALAAMMLADMQTP